MPALFPLPKRVPRSVKSRETHRSCRLNFDTRPIGHYPLQPTASPPVRPGGYRGAAAVTPEAAPGPRRNPAPSPVGGGSGGEGARWWVAPGGPPPTPWGPREARGGFPPPSPSRPRQRGGAFSHRAGRESARGRGAGGEAAAGRQPVHRREDFIFALPQAPPVALGPWAGPPGADDRSHRRARRAAASAAAPGVARRGTNSAGGSARPPPAPPVGGATNQATNHDGNVVPFPTTETS